MGKSVVKCPIKNGSNQAEPVNKNNYALISYLVCFHQKSQFIANYLTTSKGKMSQKMAKIWPPARIQGQKLSWPGIERNEDRIPPPGKVIVFRKS